MFTYDLAELDNKLRPCSHYDHRPLLVAAMRSHNSNTVEFKFFTRKELNASDVATKYHMPQTLKDFLKNIVNSIRGSYIAITFSTDHRDTILNPVRMHVCMEDQPFTLANLFVNYGDEDQQITVHARGITDKRNYTKHNKTTSSYDTALKLLRRYATPYSHDELAHLCSYGFLSEAQKQTAVIENTVTDECCAAFGSYTISDMVSKEFLHALAVGHEFTDVSLVPKLQKYADAVHAQKQAHKEFHGESNSIIIFARVETNTFSGQTISTVRAKLPKKPARDEGVKTLGHTVVTRQPVDQVPEKIQERIAALGMVDPLTYIPAVGYHAAEGMFYVYE